MDAESCQIMAPPTWASSSRNARWTASCKAAAWELRRSPSSSPRVRFHALSPLTFRLLQRLAEQPALSGREHLQALAAEAGAPDPGAFEAEGARMLAQLRRDGVLLGTRTD